MSHSNYPDYDVMDQVEHWDDHTQEIVRRRLQPKMDVTFLNNQEVLWLRYILTALLDETRSELIDFVISHIDKSLRSPIGEDERKVDSPSGSDLIRNGLAALNSTALTDYEVGLEKLRVEQLTVLLTLVQKGKANNPAWKTVPQKDYFKKLLGLTVGPYYSHPLIWSEIGHGGPAYPRGYYRIELGLTDPWEARRKESDSKDGGE